MEGPELLGAADGAVVVNTLAANGTGEAVAVGKKNISFLPKSCSGCFGRLTRS